MDTEGQQRGGIKVVWKWGLGEKKMGGYRKIGLDEQRGKGEWRWEGQIGVWEMMYR